MTQDPPRLLSDQSEADAFERELLESLHRVSVPSSARAATWPGVAAGIAAAASGSAASAAAASSANAALGTKGGLFAASLPGAATKLAVALAIAGATGGGAYWLRHEPPSAAKTPVPSYSAPPSAVETAPPTAAEPAPPSAASIDRAPEAPPAREAARVVQHVRKPSKLARPAGDGRLAAESALLQDARARLRSRDLAGTQYALDQLQAQFAGGALVQEREVLRIELLQVRGQTQAAEGAARAFVANYPKSPHVATLRRLIHEP